MLKKSKKVIIVIVEGPTDEYALSPVLRALFRDESLIFHVVYGDVTTDGKSNEVMNSIYGRLRHEMKRYALKPGDIKKVVQIIDSDGAFIPSENVLYRDNKHIEYEGDYIYTSSPQNIIERNKKKRLSVIRLIQEKNLGKTPYQILYFSRNMEHVLHNRNYHLSNDEKVELADEFADLYQDDPEGFIDFISNERFAVKGDYIDSWAFILRDTNSLYRHSNLHLIIEER